jgi:N-methylhydantoinase A/oxoprolinase/acetone carboxylase beta subunit
MGALALDGCPGTTLVMDVGGTTTDMAVVLDGVPLRAPYGIRLGPYRTLIRSLLTRSVGLGGDSEVRVDERGEIRIGPLRQGAPAALGGPVPTPTDAMIVLGLLHVGDEEKARGAMARLGAPRGWDAAEVGEKVLGRMGEALADAADAFLHDINSRPVYTIHEVLQEARLVPDSLVVIGGPAPQVADYIGTATGLPCRVPQRAGVANAVGAAVARVTAEVTLQADTQRGTALIPEADVEKNIDRGFGVEEALSLCRSALEQQALARGARPEGLDVTVTEQQVFNMVRGMSRAGQNIRLRMCITPGLIPEWT